MKVSYEWLQSYFDEKLPAVEKLTEVLTFHAFEIEGVERREDDYVIDIDILPNRSSDCLSHRGIAREIATLLDLKLAHDPLSKKHITAPDSNILEINVQSTDLVNRFSAAVVTNVEVGESPAWLKKRLEVIGQKSINNIVDATNYVMFDIGQPLHAFDCDKLQEQSGGYSISVRVGKEGEKITVLTGDEHEVSSRNLLIVDGNADIPIGIAGVKGGKVAEIDAGTKNLVIEAANFNYVSVRKTSQELKLWTDASVRFQNQPSPELALHALREVVRLVGGELEGLTEYYPSPQTQNPVTISVPDIKKLLGVSISSTTVENILQRFDFSYAIEKDAFIVTPPFERTDLLIKEDLIEEVGRVFGYHHVKPLKLPPAEDEPRINKFFYYAEKTRSVLVGCGFSEIYAYALRSEGEVALANALVADRPFLRTNLTAGLKESLTLNAHNAELLGLESVKIFEIGKVFEKGKEYTALALGVTGTDKDLIDAISQLSEQIGVDLPETIKDGIWEINFTDLVEELEEPVQYAPSLSHKEHVSFKPISPYPFVLRDIAVWVPQGTSSDEVQSVLAQEASKLLVQTRLFDVYEKEERVSYAFRLIFQSYEKTLSDDEINMLMERVQQTLTTYGWEVR
jgi:phenylalanyl-tRNA synthetase beta chain